LYFLFDFVPGISAGGSAGNGCQHFAVAAADLMPEQTPDHGTDAGPREAVGVLCGLGTGDLLIVALLPRRLDRPDHRLAADYFSAGIREYAVAGNGTPGGDGNCAQYGSYD
jgi:hypothetical protein